MARKDADEMPRSMSSGASACLDTGFDGNGKAMMLVLSLTVVVSGLVPGPVLAQSLSPSSKSLTLPQEPLVSSPRQEEAPPEPDLSFPGLIRSIGGDFKSFPTPQNIFSLVAGASVSGLAHSADRSLTASLSASHGVAGTLEPGKVIGGAIVQGSTAFGAYVLGRLTDSPNLTAVGAELVRAQVLTQGITQGIKFAAGRTRPDGTGLSFPSGHTASSFATSTVLHRHFGWKVGIPAYGLATYVAASRLSENRHYLSDVAFGAVLGVVAARHVTVRIGKTKFALTPQVVPGGAGVTLVKISK